MVMNKINEVRRRSSIHTAFDGSHTSNIKLLDDLEVRSPKNLLQLTETINTRGGNEGIPLPGVMASGNPLMVEEQQNRVDSATYCINQETPIRRTNQTSLFNVKI